MEKLTNRYSVTIHRNDNNIDLWKVIGCPYSTSQMASRVTSSIQSDSHEQGCIYYAWNAHAASNVNEIRYFGAWPLLLPPKPK